MGVGVSVGVKLGPTVGVRVGVAVGPGTVAEGVTVVVRSKVGLGVGVGAGAVAVMQISAASVAVGALLLSSRVRSEASYCKTAPHGSSASMSLLPYCQAACEYFQQPSQMAALQI